MGAEWEWITDSQASRTDPKRPEESSNVSRLPRSADFTPAHQGLIKDSLRFVEAEVPPCDTTTHTALNR